MRALLKMGSYTFYVWMAYGVAFICLTGVAAYCKYKLAKRISDANKTQT